MSEYRFPQALREALRSALPVDTSLHGEAPQAEYLYLPAVHAKALTPNNMLVQGIRGSGKSFWCAALQSADLRSLLGKAAGLPAECVVTTGFSEKPAGNLFPGKHTLSKLLDDRHEAWRIWQAVIFQQVMGEQAPVEFAALSDWAARIEWLSHHPEQIDQVLYECDQRLQRQGAMHLVLFDALDRSADDWHKMNGLLRGLLQMILEFRPYRAIRLKVFVRPDQLEDAAVRSFPDASKVMAQKVTLEWLRRDLYGLLWQYLANAEQGGKLFREGAVECAPGIIWQQESGAWRVPEPMRFEESVQRQVFHALTGPWMGRDKRRGLPYSWLPNHLADSRSEVSPRSFLAALRQAAEDPPRVQQEMVLHFESIKRGVQEASRIRVQEIEEDYPWIRTLLVPLEDMSLPVEIKDIQAKWQAAGALDALQQGIDAKTVRLPPLHIEEGPVGVLDDLIALGLMERLKDGRINMPDVYRVGYGLRRKGGVRPVRT
ncbi:MAG: hypothetical protein U5L98_16460 [Halomonas sp.]|uniref:hypothetical protein n=1 Tax=Halomonas sp. TaxID=1486246 RepID=UPI002ACD384C|nr:hypothetical protein [Halomonas sp.]MDZ7854176.1 hypothetical protein [Halomonas sp.]